MKRTIFCVALILCMAIMAGCAAQASGKTQTPISAKTELTSAQKADDMLVLVGLVKGADRVVREMFGL